MCKPRPISISGVRSNPSSLCLQTQNPSSHFIQHLCVDETPSFIRNLVRIRFHTQRASSFFLNYVTTDVNYKHYMDIWQSITNKPTPDSSIAVNQKTWSHPLQVIAAEAVLHAAQTPARECCLHSRYHCRQ